VLQGRAAEAQWARNASDIGSSREAVVEHTGYITAMAASAATSTAKLVNVITTKPTSTRFITKPLA